MVSDWWTASLETRPPGGGGETTPNKNKNKNKKQGRYRSAKKIRRSVGCKKCKK